MKWDVLTDFSVLFFLYDITICRLQKQMKIMNRNLSGKLEELHGIQHVDTHVALSEIRGQLHELTRRYTHSAHYSRI